VEHLLLTKIFDRPETIDLGKRPSLFYSAVSDGDVFNIKLTTEVSIL